MKFAVIAVSLLIVRPPAARAAEPPGTRDPASRIANAQVERSGQVAERLVQRLAGNLRWGGDAEGGAPYQLRDPRDPQRVIGFEVELAAALCDVLSKELKTTVTPKFVQYEWVSLPLGLEKGDFDLILSGFERTSEHERRYELSRPYYFTRQQLMVRRDDTRIQSLADCRDKSVGTLSGSAAERVLSEQGVTGIVGFDGQVEPYLDLELGRLDAVLLDAPIATFYGATNPKLRFVREELGEAAYVMALRRDDALLRAALDKALSQLMVSGRLRQIYGKWRLWNADQWRLATGLRAKPELAGMGFDASEQPPRMIAGGEVGEKVDIDLVAASASLWTFQDYAPLLLRGAAMTVVLSVASMAVATLLGLLICLLRLYAPAPLSWLAFGYVEFFRGIPLLLLLFFLYFGLANYGVQMPATMTAIAGFGLTYAAYESEIYRGSILAVPAGQWEAARALGMSERLAFRRIIFPQAIRIALAPMTNDFVALFKDTSLVSVIAVRELTKEYLILSRSSLKFVELGLLTAALYLAMSIPLSYLSRRLEKRWGKGA